MTTVTDCIRRVMELNQSINSDEWIVLEEDDGDSIQIQDKSDQFICQTNDLDWSAISKLEALPKAELIAYYRNVTPKLAEALKVAMELISSMDKMACGEWCSECGDHNEAVKVLEQIEKIFEGGE